MKIVIPTRGRPQDQTAYEFLVDSGFDPILVGGSMADIPEYLHGSGRVFILPHVHVGRVRQRILETFRGKVFMVDDDVRFHQRKDDGMFRRASLADAHRLMKDVDEALDDHPIVGVAQRFMGQHNPRGHMLNKRCLHVMGYNSDLLPVPDPEFRLPNSEDADFQLQVMTRGGDTCILTDYAVDDRGKYREGGCAAYRPYQDCVVERNTAARMLELWPGIVSITKNGQLRIAWKKAALR